MIKAFILDDQDINISVLKTQLAKYFPDLHLCGSGTDPVAALQDIINLSPDLLLLDINMPELDGFSFLQQINGAVPAEVIFVTAYSEFALKAFEYHAAGYLTKPVNAAKLVPVVSKAIERIRQRKTLLLLEQKGRQEETQPGKKLSLSTQNGLVFVDPASVYYCESNGNYTTFHLRDEKQMLVSRQIGQFEQLLSPQHFMRIHDRYIINLKYIKAYKRGNGGTLVLENGKELPVSIRRKGQLLQYFG